MLCKRTCLFIELNVLSESTNKTASTWFVANMSWIECTAAPHLASYPPHSCKFPTHFGTSSFSILMTTFPAILRNTSPTPIGLKPGFLSSGTSLLAIYVSSDVILLWNSISLTQICLIKAAIALRRPDVQLPSNFYVNIFSTQQHLIQMNRIHLLVLIAPFLTNSSFMSSNIIGWITGGSPLISVYS